MRNFAEDVVQKQGRVTHIINNAGVALGGTVAEVSVEDIRWLMDINFWGVVYGTKFFLPALKKEKFAHIVNFSSLFGLIAPPGQAAYCASKFAVRGFTESLRPRTRKHEHFRFRHPSRRHKNQHRQRRPHRQIRPPFHRRNRKKKNKRK